MPTLSELDREWREEVRKADEADVPRQERCWWRRIWAWL